MSVMPPPHPPEFRQRAVELARKGDAPIAKIAKDLEISESCLRNWMRADLPDDNGCSEKKELAELRRRNRLLEQQMLSRLDEQTFVGQGERALVLSTQRWRRTGALSAGSARREMAEQRHQGL
jgi:transposase